MRKFGLFTKHLRISVETVDLFPSTQNLAKPETKEVTASQGASGPVIESATGTKVTSGHMYEMANNDASASFSEWLGPENVDITEDWLDGDSNSGEVNEVGSCNSNYIQPDSELHTRPPIRNKEALKEMYPECFTGIGKFKDFEYHINVDMNVKLVVHAPWRIALSLQGKLEKELEEMVRQGIIAPVEGHSDWVNSLVIRGKPNGSLRICLDLKDLNKAIK